MRIAVLMALMLAGAAPAARALDLELYASILAANTVAVDDIASTRVDYAALQKSAPWEMLIRSLRDSDPTSLASRNDRLAFWINAYNILAIDVVQRHYPIDSIRSLGGLLTPVWKQPAGTIGGRTHTLDEIENEILRPMHEPRIHAAIVCASLSCPPLRREPYRATELDAQLDDNVRRWLADPRKGSRIDRTDHVLFVSRIFDWFSGDFGDVPSFVASHRSAEDGAWIRAQGKALAIRYFDYDWSLNGIEPARH